MTRDSRHPRWRRGTRARLALAPLTVLSVLGVSGLANQAAASTVPLVPTSVTASQLGTASDMAVTWQPATSGGRWPMARWSKLYEQVNGKFTYQSEITCGANCTSTVFRGLTFGSTYDATVTPIVMASGSNTDGANAVSNPITLTTTCTVGACVSINATAPIGPANQAAAGIFELDLPRRQRIGRFQISQDADVPRLADDEPRRKFRLDQLEHRHRRWSADHPRPF